MNVTFRWQRKCFLSLYDPLEWALFIVEHSTNAFLETISFWMFTWCRLSAPDQSGHFLNRILFLIPGFVWMAPWSVLKKMQFRWFTGFAWTEGSFVKKICGFKNIWICRGQGLKLLKKKLLRHIKLRWYPLASKTTIVLPKLKSSIKSGAECLQTYSFFCSYWFSVSKDGI